ncbi:MAG: adenylate kinase family protein [Thermoplasmatota archaeon]
MKVSICGTPGVGKSTVCSHLSERGIRVVRVADVLEEYLGGSVEEMDEEILVDLDEAREALSNITDEGKGGVVIDGHLSYLADWDLCIVLRAHPALVEDRLQERGYSQAKIRENVEAEAVSAVLIEAVMEQEERGHRDRIPGDGPILMELDLTDLSGEQACNDVLNIIESFRGKRLNELEAYRPGKVDWLEVMEQWY